jgi:YHS domain-containing protein
MLKFVSVLFLSILATTITFGSDLKIVENKKVCMVNNTVFESDQIPVKVADKTYYGCCEMCKSKLSSDPSSRVAIDPVSKKEVDKSKAIIAAGSDKKVVYFENTANYKKFVGTKK